MRKKFAVMVFVVFTLIVVNAQPALAWWDYH
ncbi:hypothetical protein CLV68_5299 [Actinokineospora cianjurensis]|uniref:Uncharacterized protein n=1 Tax=Actinokineospora cianjurensis TaxID=585224 RepID=A0A421AYM1_9PSEU|nr:hypothetical protein CLV68_5299 [Actinokineospora cianjurensis]